MRCPSLCLFGSAFCTPYACTCVSALLGLFTPSLVAEPHSPVSSMDPCTKSWLSHSPCMFCIFLNSGLGRLRHSDQNTRLCNTPTLYRVVRDGGVGLQRARTFFSQPGYPGLFAWMGCVHFLAFGGLVFFDGGVRVGHERWPCLGTNPKEERRIPHGRWGRLRWRGRAVFAIEKKTAYANHNNSIVICDWARLFPAAVCVAYRSVRVAAMVCCKLAK